MNKNGQRPRVMCVNVFRVNWKSMCGTTVLDTIVPDRIDRTLIVGNLLGLSLTTSNLVPLGRALRADSPEGFDGRGR